MIIVLIKKKKSLLLCFSDPKMKRGQLSGAQKKNANQT